MAELFSSISTPTRFNVLFGDQSHLTLIKMYQTCGSPFCNFFCSTFILEISLPPCTCWVVGTVHYIFCRCFRYCSAYTLFGLISLFIYFLFNGLLKLITLQECLVSLTSRVTSEDLVLLIYLIMLCNVSTGEEQLLRLSLSAMLSHHLFPVMLAVDYTHAMVVSIHQLVPFTCVREILRNLRIGKYTTSKLREWSMHSIQQFIQEGPSLLFQIIHLLVPNGHRCWLALSEDFYL